MNSRVDIRQAKMAECEKIVALQHASLRDLGRTCYDDAVIEGFIEHVGTMDPVLISDGTYFSAYLGSVLVGCGGWTLRTPSYSAHLTNRGIAAVSRVPIIRAVYVHPMWARRGIAATIMAAIEQEIMSAGFDHATLTATLSGIPFYRRYGWRGHDAAVLKLPGDLTFMALHMDKCLGAQHMVLAEAA